MDIYDVILKLIEDFYGDGQEKYDLQDAVRNLKTQDQAQQPAPQVVEEQPTRKGAPYGRAQQ